MLPASFFSAVAALGRLTVMPISLSEHGRDDEEDEQVQHEVEHRREIDAGVFSGVLDGVSPESHVCGVRRQYAKVSASSSVSDRTRVWK